MRSERTNKRIGKLGALAVVCAMLVSGALIATSSAAGASRPGKVSGLQASCAGDALSGKARISRPGLVTLTLLRRNAKGAAFLSTSKTLTLRARRASYYPYKFNIAAMNAFAYRVRSNNGARSPVVAASTCAPGLQVPEVPFAVLLPLSLLLLVGLPLVLRRRRLATDQS